LTLSNEWGVDDETAKVMRANLAALETTGGGSVGGHVQGSAEAPWWQDASEMTITIVAGQTASLSLSLSLTSSASTWR
jgi:hypothetical protein